MSRGPRRSTLLPADLIEPSSKNRRADEWSTLPLEALPPEQRVTGVTSPLDRQLYSSPIGWATSPGPSS